MLYTNIVTLVISQLLLQVESAIPPQVAAALIQQTSELAAPFTKTSFEKLHNEIFGSGRAARSSDVIISNTSEKDFKLLETHCHWGGWSTNMFPERLLKSHTSIVYGMESNGFMTGLECEVAYGTKDVQKIENGFTGEGNAFQVLVENAYFGKVRIRHKTYGGDIRVVPTLGQGNNHQVRFIIEDL